MVRSANGRVVAILLGEDKSEGVRWCGEVTANHRLVLAAPDLMASLGKLIDDLTQSEQHRNPLTGIERQSVVHAKKALTEAGFYLNNFGQAYGEDLDLDVADRLTAKEIVLGIPEAAVAKVYQDGWVPEKYGRLLGEGYRLYVGPDGKLVREPFRYDKRIQHGYGPNFKIFDADGRMIYKRMPLSTSEAKLPPMGAVIKRRKP